MAETDFKADVIVVGAGLSGMVAAHEAVQRGRKVLLLDQEAPQSLRGQAFWSLGGLHTDIEGRVLTPTGEVLPGLYAAGEVCGFGGGGYHGYNALEGTFLGGCLFSGRIAGQHA